MDNDSEHKPRPEGAEIQRREVHFPTHDALLRGLLFEAGPEDAPGVVLVPDVHGVSALYEELGTRLAQSGRRALVLDLYSREGAPTLVDMPAVQSWIEELPDQRILSDIATAAGFLATKGRGKIGIVGFCLGGQYAIMAACRIPQFAAAVSFYGMLSTENRTAKRPESPLDMIAELACPLLGLYGLQDTLIPTSDLDRLATACRRSAVPLELHRYPDAGHAFLNRFRPDAYRPEAAADAWKKTLRFLTEKLG